ncbi:uncharacterized protein LOC111519694 [Drosophila willistoni]|uniref:uncharacterized protein LOC111519694 n=1 Tax=Drosophila willistoni TaxID=7260 RepID=UPI001F086B0B|nr:uncharacterized protein LOC111519694 [Drosophila willistoni]
MLPIPSRYSTLDTKRSTIHSRNDEVTETRLIQQAYSALKSKEYVKAQELLLISSVENFKRKPKDPKYRKIQNPSYTKFKVSYNIVCDARYKKARHDYNAQFKHEMKMLIDHSARAIDAAAFVKWTSYTSFWPPYHNMAELRQTDRTFFKLSKKEQRRFATIMNTNFL